jgi:NAD(P)H-flavin reductase
MFRIVKRQDFGPVTYLWEIEAPEIAAMAQPGHFVIVKHGELGERIPLTVADFDRDKGTLTMVIQAVGKTTKALQLLKEGETIDALVGPLGTPTHIEKRRKVVCVGGGLGVAPVFPQLRRHKEVGSYTISILGFRMKELIFWEDKFRRYSDEYHVATDDGSYGTKGMVTDVLRPVLEKNPDTEEVIAVGPVVMMKACVAVTRPLGVRTMVSLNPIMVDGTGMCGGCRVTINGKMRFACVDGPDFDGFTVDFDEMIARNRRFLAEEKVALDRFQEHCRLKGIPVR